MCADLKSGLAMPDYTGLGFDALNDSLSEIHVSDESGVIVALDNFTEEHRGDILLKVLADAPRYWLLFGRLFGVILRTNDARYEGPMVGAMPCMWNGREWLLTSRANDAPHPS